MKVKRGDTILVTTGKDKGKTGKINKILPAAGRVVIEGINLSKRHLKPNRRNPHGGIMDIARPLPESNIAVICPRCNKPTRLGIKITANSKIRICRRCGESVGEE